jgi:hypothetical protein
MRRRNPRLQEEDVTTQAGWLFADSFLALMVIFLATISFVPSIGGGGAISSAGNIGNLAGGNYIKALNLAYDSFDATQINSDIAAFLKAEELPVSTTVLYGKVVGGFNASEAESDGAYRALVFSVKLQTADSAYFRNTKFDFGASKLLKPDQIVLRLTLSP